jgi:hypothetical protein
MRRKADSVEAWPPSAANGVRDVPRRINRRLSFFPPQDESLGDKPSSERKYDESNYPCGFSRIDGNEGFFCLSSVCSAPLWLPLTGRVLSLFAPLAVTDFSLSAQIRRIRIHRITGRCHQIQPRYSQILPRIDCFDPWGLAMTRYDYPEPVEARSPSVVGVLPLRILV